MPDDQAGWAKLRGAVPVTVRFRPDGAHTVQRHAVHRLPEAHPDAVRIDQLHAARELSPRLYQNACAVMELCHAAGIWRGGVAEWSRVNMGRAKGVEAGPEDELRALIRDGGVGFQAVLMLLDPARPDVRPYMWSRALAGLARLDGVAARWCGERCGEGA